MAAACLRYLSLVPEFVDQFMRESWPLPSLMNMLAGRKHGHSCKVGDAWLRPPW